MNPVYLVGLVIGVFPIFMGVVILQADSKGQCEIYNKPLDIHSTTTKGCYVPAIGVIIFGISCSIGGVFFSWNHDRKKPINREVKE